MFNLKVNNPRFSLYHLDEGELYIKEFVSICQFIYPPINEIQNL